jgi:cysteine desulfurase family protein (TIGR01976 family)
MPAATLTLPTIDAVRARFPALASQLAFLENAGGSQVPQEVSDAVRDHMRDAYVQLGAGYELSQIATKTVEAARAFGALLTNAGDTGRIVLGPSTTALVHIIADAYGEILQPGDEIVVAETNHEANIGPWVRLERFGVKVRFWRVDPQLMDVNEAEPFNHRTKIVAVPHTSNLLGHVVDVKSIAEKAHRVGARVFVDGVAFAPHRAVDVQALGADWYVFSMYKVYGPHMAVLFGREDAFRELKGPNHFFLPDDSPYKFEFGGVSHEACAGVLGVKPYLAFLAGKEVCDREALEQAFDNMHALERPLQERLLTYLTKKPQVQIIGQKDAGEDRVGTVSFISDRVPSDRITAHTDARGIAIRHGHMYAYRLCKALQIPPEPGVVRVSLLHYNTQEEIDRLIEALDGVL